MDSMDCHHARCHAGFVASAVTAAAQTRAPEAEAQQPPIQAKPGGPEGTPKTDQTVDVTKGTRLVLSNNAGEVVVRTWDRDQVHVQATHTDRDAVDVQMAESDVAHPQACLARAVRAHRLPAHRAALDAGESSAAAISKRPSKAPAPK